MVRLNGQSNVQTANTVNKVNELGTDFCVDPGHLKTVS